MKHWTGVIMVLALTKPTVLVQRGGGAEHLTTVFALYLCPTIGVHSFMSTEVGELSVGFVTDLTCN